jgi:hypothetical protein
MSSPPKHCTVFFVHVPKNAGSTMQDILGRQYRGERSFTTAAHEYKVRGSLDQLRGMDAVEREGLDIVKGHCVLAVEGLIKGPKKFITFLRDPFQQFKSHYYYVRRAHWNPRHEEVRRMNGLAEFLDHQVEHEQDNMQTRHLSGELDAMISEVIGGKATVRADEGLFNKAMGWLQRMDHVGLTEHFDETLIMMRNGLGWRRHCYYEVRNKTLDRPDPELDDELIERFNEVYKWDLLLFKAAKERFERDVREEGGHLQRQVANFRRANDLAQYAYRLRGLVAGGTK